MPYYYHLFAFLVDCHAFVHLGTFTLRCGQDVGDRSRQLEQVEGSLETFVCSFAGGKVIDLMMLSVGMSYRPPQKFSFNIIGSFLF